MDDRPNPTPDDLTDPSGTMSPADLPGTISPKDMEQARQWMRGDLGGAFAHLRDGVRSGLIDGFADAIRGIVRPGFQSVRDAWEDGQLALNDRLDLLDGVRGYASAYMSRNINGSWGLNNTRDLPYDAQLGPAKGATVTGGGITLDESGLWSVSLLTFGRSTDYTSGWLDTDSVRVWLRAYRPDGSLYSETPLESMAGKSATSMTVTIPLVVDQPGTYLRVSAWSSRWRWWNGGTRFSRLAVVKHDNRVLNPGAETVPDETRP